MGWLVLPFGVENLCPLCLACPLREVIVLHPLCVISRLTGCKKRRTSYFLVRDHLDGIAGPSHVVEILRPLFLVLLMGWKTLVLKVGWKT